MSNNKETLESLTKRIDIAAGRRKADLLITNCRIVNVYTNEIIDGEIAISDDKIAAVGKAGEYEGLEVVDAGGSYAMPGFIDSHIHIESSMVTPEEFGRLCVPHGVTTAIADPHEIVNVCGIKGLDYMIDAAKNTAMDIKFMLPSCVPTSTQWESSGAVIDAEDMKESIKYKEILGLGEFMNAIGVANAAPDVLKKLLVAKEEGKVIDGHAPGISGKLFNAYISAGIKTDHECGNLAEMEEHLRNGMYVMLRYGTVCHELPIYARGVTPKNYRRILLCSDDRQAITMLEEGALDNNLRLCVKHGIDPVMAVACASLNAAECYGLSDRGAIAPGLKADIVLCDNLSEFNVQKVWIDGKEVAREGTYLPEVIRTDCSSVAGSIHVKDFSEEKIKLSLKSENVTTIDLTPGTVLSGKGRAKISLDASGDFVYSKDQDIIKMSVIERHNNTGNVGTALVRGYGLDTGAIAISVAHDAHNILVGGVSNKEMIFAAESLMAQGGGIVLVNNGEILESMPLPVAGLMSDQSGEWVANRMRAIKKAAFEVLHINPELDPVMTLCFMSLCVIPEVKLTDKGLFDVTKFEFIPIEA